MPYFKIEGLPPYDGDYPLAALDELTNRELHTIKQMSGVRAGEIEAAGTAGDNDLLVALAFVTLQRAGKQPTEGLLWDAPVGRIRFVLDDDAKGDDASPPALPPDKPNDGSSGSSSEDSSSTGDDPQVTHLRATGALG